MHTNEKIFLESIQKLITRHIHGDYIDIHQLRIFAKEGSIKTDVASTLLYSPWIEHKRVIYQEHEYIVLKLLQNFLPKDLYPLLESYFSPIHIDDSTETIYKFLTNLNNSLFNDDDKIPKSHPVTYKKAKREGVVTVNRMPSRYFYRQKNRFDVITSHGFASTISYIQKDTYIIVTAKK